MNIHSRIHRISNNSSLSIGLDIGIGMNVSASTRSS